MSLRLYQGQGYSNIQLEKQFSKADAIHYSVFVIGQKLIGVSCAI